MKENLEIRRYTLLFFILNINFSLILFVAIPYLLKVVLQVRNETYAIVQSLLPIGMLLGSFISGRKNYRNEF